MLSKLFYDRTSMSHLILGHGALTDKIIIKKNKVYAVSTLKKTLSAVLGMARQNVVKFYVD